MVIDEMGFPKKSKIFKGNIGEPDTLKVMIGDLQGTKQKGSSKKDKKGITVVIDAGIADEDNLSFLKDEGYDYICVARNKPADFSKIKEDDLLTIKKDRNNKVEVKLIKEEGENILYC